MKTEMIKTSNLPILLFFIGFALLMFYEVLKPSAVLFTTDDNIGIMTGAKRLLPYSFLGYWDDSLLMGQGGGLLPPSWISLCLSWLPVRIFVNWIHALDLALASFFLGLFLRRNGLSLPACVLGGITAFWLGSNFTLTYAGHIPKFGVLMFAAAALCCLRASIGPRGTLGAILAGGCLGAMFLEQLDVALFIGLFLGGYWIWLNLQNRPVPWPRLGLYGIIMLFMVAMMAGPTIGSSYFKTVKGTASPETENSQNKWEFTTQWSWPPEECIDFIAPGYMGWRSGEPEGPYWGRMGRSAGWEQTGQGFMNFKLENHYLGAIPIIFAFFAVGAVLFRKRAIDQSVSNPGEETLNLETENRSEIIFWTCAAVIALLLSFGKYFPLYALFYQFPLVSSIRNPNKFFHIFQIAMGILAAYGFDIIIRSRMTNMIKADSRPPVGATCP